jgi:hypothetical protein
MSKTTPEHLLTRIEILERHVERLEYQVAGLTELVSWVARADPNYRALLAPLIKPRSRNED